MFAQFRSSYNPSCRIPAASDAPSRLRHLPLPPYFPDLPSPLYSGILMSEYRRSGGTLDLLVSGISPFRAFFFAQSPPLAPPFLFVVWLLVAVVSSTFLCLVSSTLNPRPSLSSPIRRSAVAFAIANRPPATWGEQGGSRKTGDSYQCELFLSSL